MKHWPCKTHKFGTKRHCATGHDSLAADGIVFFLDVLIVDGIVFFLDVLIVDGIVFFLDVLIRCLEHSTLCLEVVMMGALPESSGIC